MIYSPALQGILLALTTALFWGVLPLAVQQLLPIMDAATIVWLRFTTAAIWMWLVGRPERRRLAPDISLRHLVLFAVAALGLSGNFVLFNASLAYMSAAATQILSQSGPVLLLLGGIFVLREPFVRIQGIAVVVLLAGLLLFFNDKLHVLLEGGDSFSFGMLLCGSGAVIWAVYGLAQKILLLEFSPRRIMQVIYTTGAIVLIPLATPRDILRVDLFQAIVLAFCCANTLVAYGCFTKAMVTWHAAKVSALVTTTPLFTLLCEGIFHLVAPESVPFEHLHPVNCIGAVCVVLGALGIAIGPLLHLRRILHPSRHRS